MPQPNKQWKHKKPYVRSTGGVRGHHQRYGIGSKSEARRHYYREIDYPKRLVDEGKRHSKRETQLKISQKSPQKGDQEKINLWASNVHKYDIIGIDDPIPEGYSIQTKEVPPQIREEQAYYRYDKRTGKPILVPAKTYRLPPQKHFILYDKIKQRPASTTKVTIRKKKGKTIYHLSSIQTYDGYRQKGLTPYSFREAINWIDEQDGESQIAVAPYLPEYQHLAYEERDARSEEFYYQIRDFYGSYDMYPTERRGDVLTREKHGRKRVVMFVPKEH
jgi:hypothetical protein